jgi:hypothetical protein
MTKDIATATPEELAEEMNLRQIEDFNREAITELLQSWCMNISENIVVARRAKNLKEYPRLNRQIHAAVVVGAAPNLTDKDILALKDFQGDIIITNKNYRRFFDLDVFPDWVCVLDAHPISLNQFTNIDVSIPKESRRPNYLVGTIVHPMTAGLIEGYSRGQRLYMFNPVTDLGGQVRLSKTWQWMNDKDEMEHGGSVGTLAVRLAYELRYQRVALLGFGLCEKGDPTWTIEQAKERDHIYYPDTNEYVSIPKHFKGYLAFLFEQVQEANWCKFYNLSDSPVLRHSPLLTQMTIEQFIGETNGH